MIRVEGLYKHYGKDSLYEDFNITFEKNKISAILGASGCGKTTLLRILLGVENYSGGEIKGIHKEKIAMIFQEDRLIPWLSVYDNIKFVMEDTCTPLELHNKIKEVLMLLQLWEYKDYLPKHLSGGMQRRVAIGRAFAYEGTCILMDEPFKGLDQELKEHLLIEIKKLWERYPKTVIFVTHQLEEAECLAEKIYFFQGKPITYNIIK